MAASSSSPNIARPVSCPHVWASVPLRETASPAPVGKARAARPATAAAGPRPTRRLNGVSSAAESADPTNPAPPSYILGSNPTSPRPTFRPNCDSTFPTLADGAGLPVRSTKAMRSRICSRTRSCAASISGIASFDRIGALDAMNSRSRTISRSASRRLARLSVRSCSASEVAVTGCDVGVGVGVGAGVGVGVTAAGRSTGAGGVGEGATPIGTHWFPARATCSPVLGFVAV